MALIQAEKITKNYRMGDEEVPALKGVSFEIGEGAFAAFVGPSGSGKSTLLNLIGCLDHPSSGTLRVNGTDISTLSRSSAATFRGEHLGFVFQDFNLVPVLSAYEICVPSRSTVMTRSCSATIPIRSWTAAYAGAPVPT